MGYIWEHDYKGKFLSYLFGAFLFGAMPWMSGPYWMAVIGVFLGTYFIQTCWVILRTVWLTFWRRGRKQM